MNTMLQTTSASDRTAAAMRPPESFEGSPVIVKVTAPPAGTAAIG